MVADSKEEGADEICDERRRGGRRRNCLHEGLDLRSVKRCTKSPRAGAGRERSLDEKRCVEKQRKDGGEGWRREQEQEQTRGVTNSGREVERASSLILSFQTSTAVSSLSQDCKTSFICCFSCAAISCTESCSCCSNLNQDDKGEG